MSGSLAGIRVLEVANFVSGPCAARVLADLGARVIKVEKPASGDPMRAWGGELYSAWFIAHNAGKQSITLRLGTPEASRVLERLIPNVDVLIQNFRPGVAEALGIGYDRMRALAPRLVYCAISGAGSDGPNSGQPVYDAIGQSLSGLLHQLMNPADPQPFGPALADTVAGLFAAQGILAALYERARSGAGQLIETSIVEACLSLLGEPMSVLLNSGEMPDAESRRQAAQVYVFRCEDERLLCLHLSSPPKNWAALLRALGRDDLERDPRFATRSCRISNYAAIRAELSLVFLTRPRSEWLSVLEAEDIPCAPVNRLDEALVEPRIQALSVVRTAEHPAHGPVHWIAHPVRHSSSSGRKPMPPPSLGEHTETILGELGYDAGQIEELRLAGVI